jgi:hypothetical protein
VSPVPVKPPVPVPVKPTESRPGKKEPKQTPAPKPTEQKPVGSGRTIQIPKTPPRPNTVVPPVRPAKPAEYVPPVVQVGTAVVHKTFGPGIVTKLTKDRKHIHVKFKTGEKMFIFPDAFRQGFLKTENP